MTKQLTPEQIAALMALKKDFDNEKWEAQHSENRNLSYRDYQIYAGEKCDDNEVSEEMIQELLELGYIEPPPVTHYVFTKEGFKHADDLQHSVRIWETSKLYDRD